MQADVPLATQSHSGVAAPASAPASASASASSCDASSAVEGLLDVLASLLEVPPTANGPYDLEQVRKQRECV